MKSKILCTVPIIILNIILLAGCSKYLDKKPDKKLAVPDKLEDLQALLDYWVNMNQREPSAGNVSSDEFYVTPQDLGNASETERNQYVWANANLFPYTVNDWAQCFRIIYTSNSVLENIEKISKAGKESDWENIKGQALLFRSNAFLQAAFIWCLAYDEKTSSTDLGLPLRLNSDFNETSKRATVEETYMQVLNDLKLAATLLPEQSIHSYRPSKPAAYALLSRAYLSMRKYEDAGKYADSALAIRNALFDYNKLSTTATYPFSTFQFAANPEVIFDTRNAANYILAISIAKVDTSLYKIYATNDLRKQIFFRAYSNGSYGFKGSYAGNAFFMGVATDELYLIKAETLARNGNISDGLLILNKLLEKRWKAGTFIPYRETTKDAVLETILMERRKELYRRGIRWMDIKRLNKEGKNISLKRVLDGEQYLLQANDLRFALPLPEDVIKMSGMEQNPR